MNNYGNLLLRTDQLNASKDQYEAARAIYDVTLQEKDDEDAEEFCSYHSRELVHVWLNLGRLRKAQGDLTGAVEAAAKVRELTVIEEKKDREERWMGMEASRAYCLYTAGCLVTELAQEVAKDETLALPERQKRADEYATRAVELLRDSVLQAPLYVAFRPEGGTFEDLGSDMFTEMAITIREEYVTLLKNDAALEVLRQREDIQTILKQFEEEVKKKEKDEEKPSPTGKSLSR